MRVWKGFATFALAMLVIAGTARADDNDNSMGGGDQNNPSSDQLENPPPETPPTPTSAPTAPPDAAIMQGFDAIGIGKPMENLGFYINGYGEIGYLYDLTVPKDQTPAKTAPGDDIFFAGPYKNSFILDQVDLQFARNMVNLANGDWDAGFKIEAYYGSDAYFTHSNGILDNNNKEGGASGPNDQLDLLQAYVSLGIPVGTGLILEAGKFLTTMGYETIDPTQNLFYSHSYAFSYGTPFTMTGALVKYTFGDPSSPDSTTLLAAVTRGWNQSTYDNNGQPDGVFQIKSKTGGFGFTGNLLVGPEGVLPYGPPDNADWWVVPEMILTWQASDQFDLGFDLLYGDATHLTQWFSGALYTKYQLDPHLAIGSRFEYYHDGGGVTTGVGGVDTNYFEATFGVQLSPLPDSPLFQSLTFRPELRFDESDQKVFDFSHYTQLTAALDVYWKF